MEILIREDLARIWELTQKPQLHERWDLRFSHIEYLPRPSLAEPQHFLYQTRIGFGLNIEGTGESVGECATDSGDTTSSLKFASSDPKSLIRQGSGYWRYIPIEDGTRFFTWYDYQVKFGMLGRFIDRSVFRPLIGWATAWSFDRLRLWAELGQSPEASMNFALIHGIARITLAFIWLWHGLVPKLIYRQIDERTMLAQAGIPVAWLQWIGAFEIALGLLVLFTWNRRGALIANGLLMVAATAAVAINSPAYITAAFNPITLNFAVIALCIIGWVASRSLPTARNCLRRDPKGRP